MAKRLKQNFNEVQAILDAVGQKVDKVEGKNLSTNDYTDEDRAKLTGIEEGAEMNATSVTWAELKAARDAGELVPGKVYRVTDYVATVRNNALYSEAKSANHPFDIIVTALDGSHLSEECLAAPHEGDTYFTGQNLSAWRIWYTVDNDTATYDWADPVNGKGVVYRMIDENANDIGYDFKGILFARYPVHPLEGYEDALSDINGWYLGCKYTNDATPAGISVDTTAEAKWFYTFSRLTAGWDDPTDASLRKGVSAVYNVTIPNIMRTNSRFLSDNVFINGAFAQGKFTEFGWTEMSTTHAMHIDAMGDTSQNTFFGYAGSIQSMSQMRHNIFVGDFRHNRLATDFEGNVIVAGDISFNDLWMSTTVIRARSFFHNNGGGLFRGSVLRATGAISYNAFSARFNDNRITVSGNLTGNDFGDSFYSNTFQVTGEFIGNTINGYCHDNSVTCGNFTHNELSYFEGNTINTTGGVNSNMFGPYFEGNTLGGRLTSNRFALGQTRYCSFTDIIGSTFGGILEYVTVPAVSGKRFTHCDVKGGLRGTASVPLTLDNDAFFLASASGVTRRVTIEGTTTGKIVATWMDGDAPKGVIKTQGGEWADLGLVTKTVSDLVNYYTKNETLTREEVMEAISNAIKGGFVSVTTLPTPSQDTYGKIYLVPAPDGEAGDIKDEYITVWDLDAYAYAWERIGSTRIDLSGYVTIEGLNTALANYVTSQAFVRALSGKQDTLVSGRNIKTINGESVLGDGDIVIQGGSADEVKYTEQTLTDSQKSQARTNIAAASESEVSQLRSEMDDNEAEFLVSNSIKESVVDFSRLALRSYQLNDNGTYGTSSTYKHCLVPVVEGQVYKIVAGQVNPTRYAWFTSNAAPVSGGAAPIVVGTTRMTIPVGEERVVTAPATAKYLFIYRYTSASGYSSTPSKVALLGEKAELLYVEPTQTNLIDPSKVIGGYIDNNGRAYESENYYQTDYIPIDAETDYTVLCKTWSSTYYYRYVCFYDSSKTRISGISTTGKTFTSPANSAFAIVSLYANDGSNNIDPKNYGLFKGVSPSFSPYYGNTIEIANVPLEKKGNDAIVTKRDLFDTIENLDGIPPMTVTYTNPGITISADGYSNGCSLDRHNLPQFAYSSNHIFNFDNLSFGEASSSTMNDDVAPSHFQNTTLGANHAQPTQIATIPNHGKTNADIGTAWVKDTTTFYIVRIVDENNIEFLSENKGTYNNHNFVALTTGTITKDGESMTITAISSSQLWPSVANKRQKILLDGESEVTAAGTFKCHFVDIVESYDMVNSADVITNLIARIGSDEDPVYTGNPMLRFENIYRFYPDGQILVMENVIALQDIPIQDIMFNQMALFGSKNYVKTYVPNSLPIGDYDFRTPLLVDWSSSVPSLHFYTRYWKDGNNPPNRVVMIKANSSASNGYGIALGFLPIGVGKDLKAYTDDVFELRNNTGKIYPHGVTSEIVGATMNEGDAYNAVMYRVPFNPQPAYRIAYYAVPFNDCVYVYVDYSESKAEQLTVDERWNGKPITVIEAANCNLLTDVYNHGFRVKATYVTGETCFIVVKIG